MLRRTRLLTIAAFGLLLGCAAAGTAAGASTVAEPTRAARPANPNPQQAAPVQTPVLLPGTRVRVYRIEDDDALEGTFLGADEVSFRIRDDDDTVSVGRLIVRRIEVTATGPRPTSGKRLAIGALIGGGAGLGAGATAAYILSGGISGDPDYNPAPALLTGVAVGAGLGALIAHATRGPGWAEVPVDRVRVSVSPAPRHGLGVLVALRF